MDGSYEIVVPTFINCHTFWIIPKKDLILRSALNRVMTAAEKNKKIQEIDSNSSSQEMVAVNIENVWARGIVEDVIELSRYEKEYVCWLPDYGIKRVAKHVFHIPEDLKKCPHLAKQASLLDVVNLMTDFTVGDTSNEFKLKKTVNDIEGVRRVALDCIENAHKLFFNVCKKDEFNIYGDIICCSKSNLHESLTDILIKKKLLAVDRDLFKSIEADRKLFKEAYFKHSQMWHQKLDKTETHHLSKIIWNKEINTSFSNLEFFKRKQNT